MRKVLLLAGCALMINSANAQSILGTGGASEWGQLTSWANQRIDNARELAQLVAVYRMAENTWSAVHGARDVGGMVNAIGSPMRQFVPEAAGLVDGVGYGARLLAGAGRARSANQLFSAVPQAARFAQDGARWLEEMNMRETNTANVQTVADSAIQDIEGRIASLGIIQTRIAASDDIKDIETVSATIAVEKQNLALHQTSLQALQLKLAAADRTEATRREQWEAQGAQRWATSTQTAVDQLQGE